jgi:hypothetical protein
MLSIRRPLLAVCVLVSLGAFTAPADAVILYRSSIRNKTAPTGANANSGWQWEGHWAGGFEGTPIASRYFISAAHLGGGVGQAIYFGGKNHTVVAQYDDPSTDLKIYKIADTFSTFAPLYTSTNEVGKRAMIFGRGTGRGDAVVVNGQTKGWKWGTQDKVDSWGENMVSSTLDGGSGFGQLLKFTFNKGGLTNEGALSTGDSGGGVFINDGGKWKLAGLNYLVEGPFSLTSGGATFNASLFDKGGVYLQGSKITDTTADVPGAFYATRVSSRISWINSILKGGTGAAAFQVGADASAVPEPASIGVLAIGAISLLRRRR